LDDQVLGRGSVARGAGVWSCMVAAALAAGCGSNAGDDDTTDGCVPGRSVACTTTEGCDGAQECKEDGTYDVCVCGADPSDGNGEGSGGGGSSDGGSANDSSLGGSSAGSGATSGGGTGSAGANPSTGGVSDENCSPVDMGAWTPPAYVPARQTPGACTTAQIQRFYDDCLMGSDCSAFEESGADADCGACMWPSPLDSSTWGPVLEVNPRPFYRWENNTAGCHELLRASNRDCAEKMQTAQNCAREACIDVCNVTGQPYNDCVIEARTSSCTTYTTEATCITSQADLDACSGTGFEQIVLAQGEVFCG